jgi:hypothetical protein
MFRPGYMQPTKGLRNALGWYKAFAWAYPFWRLVFPDYVCTLREVGMAMINSVRVGYEERVLEVRDIAKLANTSGLRK